MTADETKGIEWSLTLYPFPSSSRSFWTSELASSPNAEPPDKTIASTLPIELSSLRISVALVPAPPPLTSTAAVKGFGPDSIVTPVENLWSSAQPTKIPLISVIKFFIKVILFNRLLQTYVY